MQHDNNIQPMILNFVYLYEKIQKWGDFGHLIYHRFIYLGRQIECSYAMLGLK